MALFESSSATNSKFQSTFRISSIIALTSLIWLSGCAVNHSKTQLQPLTQTQNECVVLVHGLWRSGFAMRTLANEFEAKGYHTVSIDYPSTEKDIPTLAEQHLSPGVRKCQQQRASKIHLVSHSMGGILIRAYLQTHALPEGSRVVMMSPPNQGSALTEAFGKHLWYQNLVGPAATSLTKQTHGIITKLQPIKQELGIIAAYRKWSIWPSSWLPAPNDGTVSVENMKLPEMDDFIMINSGHAVMRNNDQVMYQAIHFIQQGHFFNATTSPLISNNQQI